MHEKFKNIKRQGVSHISFNIGLYCNQLCTHCHLSSGPERTEMMDSALMAKMVEFIKIMEPDSFEITGGAPELNPHISEFILMIRPFVKKISMRTNLTALELNKQPEGINSWGKNGFFNFLYENNVSLVASLPCYEEEEVRIQRGDGIFEKSIEILKMLNDVGYGKSDNPALDLVFNPIFPKLPPKQSELELEYKEVLSNNFGVIFNNLIVMANVPVGRFAENLRINNSYDSYISLLRENFNKENLEKLMCLSQVTIDWKGRFYDCDFNLAIDLPKNGWSDLDKILGSIKPGKNEWNLSNTRFILKDSLIGKRIFTGQHCLTCSAGSGSSCHGALQE
jgi:radical SAM/Cys-rich protein